MSISEWHVIGGFEFMTPISLLFLVNTGIVIYIIYSKIKAKQIHVNLLETIKQVSALALAWGAFGTLVGLFGAFNALEAMEEVIPFQVMMGGMKVAIMTLLYGLLTYCIFILAYIVLKLATIKGEA
jgi:hypothetical protein